MRHDSRPDAILIAGPTASGKSALAMELAGHLGALVINADSMQVYRDLRILTARPSEADEAMVPHALYGTIDGAIAYSVSQWLADAVLAMEMAARDGLIPLFVGGTGLYLKALTQGLSDIPPVPAAVRAEWRAWADGRPTAEIHGELARRDPLAAARIRPTDPQRLLRAIEVHAATGESLVSFQGRRAPAPLAGRKLQATTLAVDREVLRERVARRLDAMVAQGAMGEVEALLARGLDRSLPVMRALGVPQFAKAIGGEIDCAAACRDTCVATRAYIKRQATFFRHQLPDVPLINPDQLRDRWRISSPGDRFVVGQAARTPSS